MEHFLTVVSLWLAMAVMAAAIAYHLRLSIAIVEICIGMAAATAATYLGYPDLLGENLDWLKYLAGSGAVLLTFLAGAELDPEIIRTKLGEVSIVGAAGFLAPFLGCTALAYYGLGWDGRASWLAGIVLATTSLAVIYSVLLDTGLNRTAFGKGILGASFINDFSSVLVLSLLFAPFTWKTLCFIAATALALWLLPHLTGALTRRYAFRTAAIRTKWVLLVLFSLGALSLWAGSEAVLPAYLAGITLAGTAGRDAHWLRRLRTLTVGFLTPFYFLRAGTLVSVSAIAAAPLTVLLLLGGKMITKVTGVFPVVTLFRRNRRERWYYTLLMSTGLTFGIIAALYGLTHALITKEQYACLMAAVIASAVLPALVAGLVFTPSHLLHSQTNVGADGTTDEDVAEEG